MDSVGSRVIPLTDEGDLWKRHFSSAEMVIEAVPENLDLKHRCGLVIANAPALRSRYTCVFLVAAWAVVYFFCRFERRCWWRGSFFCCFRALFSPAFC